MKLKPILALLSLLLISSLACAEDETNKIAISQTNTQTTLSQIAPYPQAPKDMNRHVISLQKQNDEEDIKIELIVEKLAQKDCNHVFYSGQIEKLSLKGWGYNYYQIKADTDALSTLMGCPDAKQVTSYVPVNIGDMFLRYNSKLPIVIYAPKEVKISYRLWKAENKVLSSKIE